MTQYIPLIIALTIIVVSFYFQTRHIISNWKKYINISYMYDLPAYRNSFRIGLILTGILQILFILSFDWQNATRDYQNGVYFFIFGSIGAIVLGIFSFKENKIVHLFASFQYFLGLAIGATLISFEPSIPFEVRIVSIGIVSLWVIISSKELATKNGWYSVEGSHVLLSYVWILLLSLTYISV